MTFPDCVRTHQIVNYWYCAERSRLMACERIEFPKTDRMDEGLEVHSWLELRPKSKKELGLYEKLKFFEPFCRVFDGVKVLAHPDDLTVLGRNKIQIVEYKTVDKSNVKPWKSVLAKYQTQIYAWVLEPILKELGYRLAHYHTVVYLKRNGVFLRKVTVEQDNYCVERMIKQVFGFWKTGQPLITPLKWKCQECPSVCKEKCRVYNKKGEAHE
ncbi:MAG: hypothetical protein QHH15_01980 [Candidatus Thermoplasmatota archaeon]|jgi:CRISPR/Cas system-associated exonuclease Cas4 (RecB family)|nr:hypothetical protein [Candidatus Thermoplasmatota archaeon]